MVIEKLEQDSDALPEGMQTLRASPQYNRQYSYPPTVLGRVGLDHECEAHAGTFLLRRQINMRKLRLSLRNLRKTFNIVKFRRAYILERSLFQTTKGRSAHYY